MILLYTGSQSANAPQIVASNSLGGYVSSSPIPNGRIANLFSTIAKGDVTGNKSVIRMIALKNTTGSAVTGVTVYSSIGENSHIKLKLAAVSPALDGNGNPVFESVFDGNSIPYQATLSYHEGSDNSINVGSMAANAVIGIWILREIDQTKFPELNTDATGEELAELIEAANSVSEEAVSLIINYN